METGHRALGLFATCLLATACASGNGGGADATVARDVAESGEVSCSLAGGPATGSLTVVAQDGATAPCVGTVSLAGIDGIGSGATSRSWGVSGSTGPGGCAVVVEIGSFTPVAGTFPVAAAGTAPDPAHARVQVYTNSSDDPAAPYSNWGSASGSVVVKPASAGGFAVTLDSVVLAPLAMPEAKGANQATGTLAVQGDLAAPAVACTGASVAEGVPDAADAPPALPQRPLYESIQTAAFLFPEIGGDWADDFGDAAYYGPAFYVAAGLTYGRADYLSRGHEALDHDIAAIRKANADLGTLMDTLDEALMAALGLIEVRGIEPGDGGIADLDTFVDDVDTLLDTFNDYVDIDMDSYALKTYGPTAVTAVAALLDLRYAELLKTPRSADRSSHGLKILAAIDAKAWDGTRYVIRPGDATVEIYPQVSMIIANVSAYNITGDAKYRDRAVATFQAMQPLKDPVKKCYRSPYSAQYMGAKTDDYTTLSSQNYAVMAFALLYQATSDAQYMTEIGDILAFLDRYLFVGGRLLHHWMDGRIAVPSDPEYFCTGCNEQFLYGMWYVEQKLCGGR